jgi:peroxiredoxin
MMFAKSIALGLKLVCCASLLWAGITTATAAEMKPPQVGDTAADFQLKTPAGDAVELEKLNKQGPVVLVVLRGFPGYQCPICNAQVGKLLGKAEQFAKLKASIVLVYPGESNGLKERADEFIRGKTLPNNVTLAIDPAYEFTNKYNLRWEKKGETAYPSTFVIDDQGKIVFAKISKTHGDRAAVEDVLQALAK